MTKTLTVNLQKRNSFTIKPQIRKPILVIKCLRYPELRQFINDLFNVTQKYKYEKLQPNLNPWGVVGYLRFELSYTKATRRHLCQLDVVFVVILY